MLPTAKDLQRSQRYLDRLLRDKERALARMRERGATLHHTHRPGRSRGRCRTARRCATPLPWP